MLHKALAQTLVAAVESICTLITTKSTIFLFATPLSCYASAEVGLLYAMHLREQQVAEMCQKGLIVHKLFEITVALEVVIYLPPVGMNVERGW